MKIALVTDAWQPQVNGVVTTLVELVKQLELAGHTLEVIEPGGFRTRPCPGYRGIDLAVAPKASLTARLDAFQPDAIHLATEGPLGWAGRSYCIQRGLAFTTAFHTKFPEIGVDVELFPFHPQPRTYLPLGELARPVALFVGRVSYEKNIAAFLEMDFPGTKLVCGVGPVQARLRARFPHVHWLGLLPRHELATVYAAADLFVFPSHADTFGLVMVEAMATGTPVAAYPVDGPLEVLGRPRPDGTGSLGGAMHADLQKACWDALSTPRHEARSRALDFSWTHATQVFLGNLVPACGVQEHPVDGTAPVVTAGRAR